MDKAAAEFFKIYYHGVCDSVLPLRMCHTADGSERKTISDNSVDFLAMTASLLSYVFVHVMLAEIVVAVQRSLFVKIFFSVSPCRQIFGSEEKLQPIVEYRSQRSYNRSVVGVTRMFFKMKTRVNTFLRCPTKGSCK